MSDDNFIGSVFNDGKLVVVGWNGERSGNSKVYQVKCSVCAQDPELFDDATFRSTKFSLVNRGILPCGCSKKPHWTAAQRQILISRKAAGKYSVVVPDDDVKVNTKVSCRCNAEDCGCTWSTTIGSLVNNGTACRKCGGKAPILENTAIENIQNICLEKGWIFRGFENGWHGIRSGILLECSQGHKWSPKYTDVVHRGTGCSKCSKYGYDSSKSGWLYCCLWENKDTNHHFLKFGITNYPKQRLTQQKRNTKYVPKQLFSIPFADGKIPENLETVISEYKKANNIPNQVSREDFPDGHTETLPLSCWDFICDLVFQTAMIRLQPITL